MERMDLASLIRELEGIDQGTLIAINDSLGFYHGHLYVPPQPEMRIGGDNTDKLLLNPVELRGSTQFPKSHLFYAMRSSGELCCIPDTAFPIPVPLVGILPLETETAYGMIIEDPTPPGVYALSRTAEDIIAQFEAFNVPPGYEPVVYAMENAFLPASSYGGGHDESDEGDGPKDILRFPG